MLTDELEAVARNWPAVSTAVRVPHDEESYTRLVNFLDLLSDEVGEVEEHSLASLMEVVGILIEKYEDDHVPELEPVIEREADTSGGNG
jgi:HTH-type transcriptional regulator / antitoxin HigA